MSPLPTSSSESLPDLNPAPTTMSLAEIAARIGAVVEGDASVEVSGISTLDAASSEQISFLANPAYQSQLVGSRASAVICSSQIERPADRNYLLMDDPYMGFALAAALFERRPVTPAGVHASAQIDADTRVGERVAIGPNVVIQHGCEIGDDVEIGPNCVVEAGCRLGHGTRLAANVYLGYDSWLGERCLLHAGVVIGSDGFGHAEDRDGHWHKIPQIGGVRIGNDVEIGANTTVDRGALLPTQIEDDVKIDNQVQIAHNVRIGAHTAIAGCVGIAGSTQIGRHCKIGGAVGIVGHLKITDHVVITAMTSVISNIEQPGVYASSPDAMPKTAWHRAFVVIRKLDDWSKRIRRLERQLER